MSADMPPLADPATLDSSSGVRGTSSSESEHQQRTPSDTPHVPLRIRRRRHLPMSDDQSSRNQIFYFVDSNSSSREKRAHVMRHHVQEKRRQRKPSHSRNDGDKKSNRPLRYSPWPQKRSDVDSNDDYETFTPQEVPSEAPVNSDSLVPFGLPPLQSPPPSVDDLQSPSPVTLLDASRKDPFDSLSAICSSDDLELADYWTNRLTYWSGQNKYIKDLVFKAAMDHPLCFQTVILTYCARWKAQLYDLKNTKEAEHHLGKALEGIKEARKGTSGVDEDTLALALSGMSLHEDRFGDKQLARRYEDQAVQILRSRSGPPSTVEVFMHYVRYVMMPPPMEMSEDGKQWLVTFLRAAEGLMRQHSTGPYLMSVPQRRTAFQMDSPLFPLLSSGPRPSQVPQDARMYVVQNAPTQEITRTAALIYITAALWDLQESASKTGRFLNHLHRLVRDHKLDRYPACETFIWLLLEEGYTSDLKDPERGWSTGELLKMHKQLRPDLQFQYNEILYSLLMLTSPIRGIDAFEQELLASP
ncbi:hypothetical protein BO94DRAFT_532014 [Aspergillus sclerotioniger CBS 115572]|uniref:Uncharacterized protein n=1 Tax=Aspergillus sclerotioniger CBS 115572 TaxID=1450535 RepID=A0A317X8U8_9EURO|nr:hypothetical protein BO94DRAFT_532014 [Aspergillus sclerotioniger CBS 115572]PWY94052.1 hypothetical protein BO94DRAFT_532014 [Aspergillus sclerotioniger CBS 115572]